MPASHAGMNKTAATNRAAESITVLFRFNNIPAIFFPVRAVRESSALDSSQRARPRPLATIAAHRGHPRPREPYTHFMVTAGFAPYNTPAHGTEKGTVHFCLNRPHFPFSGGRRLL
jgi:hypothetical protein